MGVTIKDVARSAGVSYSTVSKALRDSSLVKPGTKQKIRDIAAELGYQPNAAARSLVSKKSQTIGVVWPTVERTAQAALITRINQELEKRDYTTLLSINKIEQAVNTFQRFDVDAILIFNDQKKLEKMHPSSIPVLTYGVSEGSDYPTIDANRQHAIRMAVEKLVEKGHKNISFVGVCSGNDPLQEDKLFGFKQAMKEQFASINDSYFLDTNGLDMYDGYLAVKSMLETGNLPSAMVIGSYDLTRGAIRAINEDTSQQSQEIELISYDNIPQMHSFDNPITNVGVPLDKIVQTIVDQLIDMIEENDQPGSTILEPELFSHQ
ncbi:LacI family DNA-binding transcriptional regulator [Salipaludibacillus sp. HK11]|uniref:LacI family DNA-binding transcriptional regulator n=1 Tax=Salipaludibacillus sp. HK11 TaxID=3394320 RepID=UPI0039FC7685